eukprot:7173273-Ditylum_brightwellii.AAC.1
MEGYDDGIADVDGMDEYNDVGDNDGGTDSVTVGNDVGISDGIADAVGTDECNDVGACVGCKDDVTVGTNE